MKRTHRSILLGTFLIVALSAMFWLVDGRERRPVIAASSVDIPNQWLWQVRRSPSYEVPSLFQVILRHQKQPFFAEPQLSARTQPLYCWEGTDQILFADCLAAGHSFEGGLSFAILDLRHFGEPFGPDRPPLRARGVMKSEWTHANAVATLRGHSVRGQPVMHPENWLNGELPLVTFTTAEVTGLHHYTVLLAVRPHYE